MNRYLVRAGVASRREADRLIAEGAVLVDGRRPPPTGTLVDPEQARVSVAGREVRPAAGHRHLALNKPARLLVTERDPRGRPTVFDLLREHGIDVVVGTSFGTETLPAGLRVVVGRRPFA